MGGFGGQNPFPFEFGGGTTLSEQVYLALRKAAGLRAGEQPIEPQGGIADAWRWAKAKAIASALSSDERAALQAFPDIAEDRLAMYESMLMLAPADALATRQQNAGAAWTKKLALDIPGLLKVLQAIDPAITLDMVDPVTAIITNFGKVFAGLPGAGQPTFGSGHTAGMLGAPLPNYSTFFYLLVRYTLSGGATSIAPDVEGRIIAHLNEALPSWVDFVLYVGTGFFLDGGPDGTSLLDQTGFG